MLTNEKYAHQIILLCLGLQILNIILTNKELLYQLFFVQYEESMFSIFSKL